MGYEERSNIFKMISNYFYQLSENELCVNPAPEPDLDGVYKVIRDSSFSDVSATLRTLEGLREILQNSWMRARADATPMDEAKIREHWPTAEVVWLTDTRQYAAMDPKDGIPMIASHSKSAVMRWLLDHGYRAIFRTGEGR